MQAIETSYAGHRFRSRLEARWAVFFDYLGITWQYEPQGFEIYDRNEQHRDNYLPDFWLPHVHLWAEVKGVITPADLQKLCWATLDRTGLPKDPSGVHLTDAERNRPRILLLGQIPRIDMFGDLPNPAGYSYPFHYCFCHHKGDVILESYNFRPEGVACRGDLYGDEWRIWSDCGDWIDDPEKICDIVLEDNSDYPKAVDGRVRRSYYAARSARFEFGETP